MRDNTPARVSQTGMPDGLLQTLVFQSATLALALSLSYSSVAAAPETNLLAAISPAQSATTAVPATPISPEKDPASELASFDKINDLATMEELAEPVRRKPAPRPVRPKRLPLQESLYQATPQRLVGMASWYGPGFHGRRAADGSRFDQHALTAAHKSLPFGTVVRVTNQRTGKSVLVRITDRGPYIHGRIIDLSMAAADAIGMRGSGVARVTVDVLAPRDTQTAEQPHEVANIES